MKKALFIIGLLASAHFGMAQTKVSAEEMEKVIAKPQTQLWDVRTPQEFSEGHIPNAVNVDWKDQENFKKQLANLKKDQPVYIYCLGGGRSKQASEFLTKEGYTVYDYSGGMMDWRKADKPEIKTNNAKEPAGMSKADYDHVVNSSKVVLVNFSAVWCGPCQQLKPILLDVEKKHSNQVKLVRIDADKNRELAKTLKVSAIPQIKLYKDGKLVWDKTGVATESEIVAQVKKANN
ncbi:thioredoxin domain-containing protein [Sphingobacterium hotanense]|uniref:thioredoxin domain-containing protein n=1 Tax=Sphingobacterium hotanense TaxID=649196 RepID=UPI0021A7F148|nr:thioredoxin domain-containing protein [Sphingobacterium hotanense]MCT1526409.1 thioredoxin domain-containing protein [Sphingobacterium hotanense]